MARISGRILDRFDILLNVAELRPAELLPEHLSESTQKVRERIMASRQFAASRQSGKDDLLNAHLDAKSLNDELKDNEDIRSLYSEALEKQALSARGFHKSIRVARTIADLAASPVITRYHVLEALSYHRFFCLVQIMASDAAPYLSIALLANLPPPPKIGRPCFVR